MPKKTDPEVLEKVREEYRAFLEEHPNLTKQRNWAELARKAYEKELKTSTGVEWTGKLLETRFYVFLKRLGLITGRDDTKQETPGIPEPPDAQATAIISDVSDVTETTSASAETSAESDASETTGAPQGDTEKPENEPLPEAWEPRILEIVRAEVKRLMEFPTLQTLPTIPLPPERVKSKGTKGRPVGQGERVKVGITLDKNLFERFEAERKRLGLSASGFADVVFWNFFGQPPMSYEVPVDAEATEGDSD